MLRYWSQNCYYCQQFSVKSTICLVFLVFNNGYIQKTFSLLVIVLSPLALHLQFPTPTPPGISQHKFIQKFNKFILDSVKWVLGPNPGKLLSLEWWNIITGELVCSLEEMSQTVSYKTRDIYAPRRLWEAWNHSSPQLLLVTIPDKKLQSNFRHCMVYKRC